LSVHFEGDIEVRRIDWRHQSLRTLCGDSPRMNESADTSSSLPQNTFDLMLVIVAKFSCAPNDSE
jgi:hypothetical protein